MWFVWDISRYEWDSWAVRILTRNGCINCFLLIPRTVIWGVWMSERCENWTNREEWRYGKDVDEQQAMIGCLPYPLERRHEGTVGFCLPFSVSEWSESVGGRRDNIRDLLKSETTLRILLGSTQVQNRRTFTDSDSLCKGWPLLNIDYSEMTSWYNFIPDM